MECFYHQGTTAVGSCRACLKGLCRGCASELFGGLACAGRCEPTVRAIVGSLEQTTRYQGVSTGLLSSARGVWTGLAVVAALVGLFVVIWGLSLPTFREVTVLGVPFFGLAFIAGRLAWNVGRPGEAETPPRPAA